MANTPTSTQHGAQTQTQTRHAFSSHSGFPITEMPSGALHQTIREGSPSGRTPTSIDQTVVYDYTTVGHGIGGRQQRLGEIRQLSDLHEWLREAMMAMREGEVRRIMLPCCSCEGGGTAAPYVELHLISIL
mmetsp:Transcript_1726/g.4774  ORF Transcript_1726/g.4774 Transcript_1726/m.4774 type:complete len:131 (+) Transcript_1726:741-1133(+)